jgi:iron(III) transport system permease protein
MQVSNMNKQKRTTLTPVKVLLAIFFLIAVVFPLIRMMMNIADTDVSAILNSARFKKGLINSLTTTIVATLISVFIATVLSLLVERSNIKFKRIWKSLFILPMLIPSISHGIGLIALFGRNGIITNLFNLPMTIYGFWGIVIGSVMYSFPVAFLMIDDVLKFEDSTPYEAAVVLDINKRNQITAIFLPYIRKPMISIVFATFTMIVTDYGVPLMIGGQYTTLPVVMFQDVIGLLDFGKGSVIGLVLLLPALVAFLLDLLNKDDASSNFVIKPFEINKNKILTIIGYILCLAVVIFIMLPIFAFLVMSFVNKYPVDMSATLSHIGRTMQMKAGKYLGNSLIISFCVAVVGVVLSTITAYCTARIKTKFSKVLHLLSILTLAIPGLVLGLSYVLFFNGTFIYGTLAILIMANLMHFFASPYLMMYNTYNKLNPNLESVGETLGLSKIYIFRDVILPLSRSTIYEMFSYFFVNSMMTISAVSFLSSSSTQPLSLMIPMFEAQMMLESASLVSLLILLINLAMKGLIYLFKKQRNNGVEYA